MKIQQLEANLTALRTQLANHPLYDTLEQVDDIKLFMEHHIFAVWDFMSLLKSLQNSLTQVQVPWYPSSNASLTRFINEIVLGEESDVNEEGIPKSHFEMYLEAMEQLGADTRPIHSFIRFLQNGHSVHTALDMIQVSQPIKDFVQYTFSVIQSGKAHQIASSFTFGREELIPDLFINILKTADPDNQEYTKLTYYLQRHIELDGDEHGPLAQKMMQELCQQDEIKWQEAQEVAIASLQERIALWDAITVAIQQSRIARSLSLVHE